MLAFAHRTSWLAVAVLAASGLLVVTGAGAQEQAPEAGAATIVEQVTVNVVNIDVHVTDRRGRPISDLSVEDFEVFEEGEPMPITNFFNAASRSDRLPEDREWVENDGEALTDAEATDAPLLVAVYVDRYRTSLGSLRRIESDFAAFLGDRADSPEGRRYLLATGDPDLNVRVPFTDDPSDLAVALRSLKPLHDPELLRRQALRRIRTSYENCALAESSGAFVPDCVPCQDMWADILGSAEEYAAETQLRAADSLSALGELAAALGGLPGPKALVHVSDGLPLRPGAELFHFLGELCPERQQEMDRRQFDRDETTRFNHFSAFSNANRVTIYPVDAAGVRPSSSADASVGGPVGAEDGGGAGGLRLANVLVPSHQNDRLRTDNLQAALSLLADETGGRAVFKQARPAKALEEIAADFGSYYSLGYAAPASRRYPIRQIDVRLTKPGKGWRVRYRRSYIFKSDEQRLADRLFAALQLGEQTNPLGAEVAFGEPSSGEGKGQATLPVEVRVPASAVTLLPGPSGPAGAVRIFLFAENEDGGRTPMRQKTLTLNGSQLPAPEDDAVVIVNVDLPPGRFEVAVGIRDEASGRASYLVSATVVELPGG
jgi:VWFA-related protein